MLLVFYGYVMGTNVKRFLKEAIMVVHVSTRFYEEILESTPELSSNTHLIWSTVPKNIPFHRHA